VCTSCCNYASGTIDIVPPTGGSPAPSNGRYLVYHITGVSGVLVGYPYSQLRLWVDGTARGLSLAARLRYDFNGDGVFDRTEVFASYNLFGGGRGGFELWSAVGLPNRGSRGLRYPATGSRFPRVVRDATIELTLWQPGSTIGLVEVRTDRNVGNQLSTITLPYTSFKYDPRCGPPLHGQDETEENEEEEEEETFEEPADDETPVDEPEDAE